MALLWFRRDFDPDRATDTFPHAVGGILRGPERCSNVAACTLVLEWFKISYDTVSKLRNQKKGKSSVLNVVGMWCLRLYSTLETLTL